MRSIGILGGTFDPIHNAHLRLAHEALEQLKLDQIRFTPLNIPPHREKPVASSFHRKEMIDLAVENTPGFYIDCRELENEEISYSINTLKSLRQEFINDSLNLILGFDAFNKIDSWKDWQELLHYAHIIVANRPSSSKDEYDDELSTELKRWIEDHQTKDQEILKKELAGHIYFITIPILDISSSMVRQCYKEGKPVDNLLDVTTQDYIKNNHLYRETA